MHMPGHHDGTWQLRQCGMMQAVGNFPEDAGRAAGHSARRPDMFRVAQRRSNAAAARQARRESAEAFVRTESSWLRDRWATPRAHRRYSAVRQLPHAMLATRSLERSNPGRETCTQAGLRSSRWCIHIHTRRFSGAPGPCRPVKAI